HLSTAVSFQALDFCSMRAVPRTIRAVRILARDGRIPRPLRGLVVVGLLPVPGPVDEAVLLLAGGLLFAFYRDSMREASRDARSLDATDRSAPPRVLPASF